MNKQQAIDTVNQYMQYLLGDFPKCVEMMTDDFVWENFLPAQVPFGGSYEGKSGLETYLGQISNAWEIGELVFTDFIFDPETQILAATGVEKNGKSTITGRTCDMAFVWEFRFAPDGRLRYLREYNDTAAIGGTYDI